MAYLQGCVALSLHSKDCTGIRFTEVYASQQASKDLENTVFVHQLQWMACIGQEALAWHVALIALGTDLRGRRVELSNYVCYA